MFGFSMFLLPCMYIGAVTVLTSTEYGTLSYGYGNCMERILHEASISYTSSTHVI